MKEKVVETNQKPDATADKSAAQENLSKLPAYCFGVLLVDKSIIRINAGEIGYYKLSPPESWSRDSADKLANELNEGMGVTPQQRYAMEAGSMFGWEIPGANPEIYNADGSPNRAFLKAAVAA